MHVAATRDRVAKPRAYAQGQVPLYLLIDRVSDPAAVTLFRSPERDGYQACERATAGQALHLPEPFAISLDVGTLLG